MAATPYLAYGALYIKRLLNTVGPRKRSAAGQAVPICTRLRSRRCAGWRLTPYPAYGALYIKRLLCFVGPRKRSAAWQPASDSVPVAVPDGGCALSGLRKAAEPELSNGYSTP